MFSSLWLGHILHISTPLSTTPSVESAVFALPITHIGVNLQIPVSLLFYLGLFLLLYWSHIVMTSGRTSLSFISIRTIWVLILLSQFGLCSSSTLGYLTITGSILILSYLSCFFNPLPFSYSSRIAHISLTVLWLLVCLLALVSDPDSDSDPHVLYIKTLERLPCHLSSLT